MKQKRHIKINWVNNNKSDTEIERLIDSIIDIYCDGVINKLNKDVDKRNPQRYNHPSKFE